MSKLQDITVSIETNESTSYVPAILNELLEKIQNYNQGLSGDSIDLRTLPLFPGDYERLKETLGQGEIQVKIDAMGPTEIYETSVPGIWWITHYNSENENVAEYIEITSLPDLLRTDALEIQRAEQQLQQLIQDHVQNLNS